MADELWNRVNISFPGAVSSVRISFTNRTDELIENVLLGNKTVLKLLDSEILQTEVRVLYELLYNLKSSYRGNKTYRGLKQVEQCVNRLKTMKLVEVLFELAELCPNKIQRDVAKKTGEFSVPSQPMLEWLCLKVLGAAHLMNRTLQCCTRTFLLCNQHMKLEEFIVLNMVITSMLSRLWVIFRGVLVSLSTLYKDILGLCKEVSDAKPMPFLATSSLPPNMSELLDPALLHDQICEDGLKKTKRGTEMGETLSGARQKKHRPVTKVKEDLGISIKRDIEDNSDLKPFVNIFNTFTKKSHPKQQPKNIGIEAKTTLFKDCVKNASSFGDIYLHLEKMITWCKCKKIVKERHRFNYLRLKCQKMKGLETEGYNVQKKLKHFRWEVLKTCSKSLLPRRTNGANLAAWKKKVRPWTDFHSLRSRLKSNNVKTGCKGKRQVKKRKSTKSRRRREDKGRRTEDEAIPQSSHCGSQDDIDDIFASIGL